MQKRKARSRSSTQMDKCLSMHLLGKQKQRRFDFGTRQGVYKQIRFFGHGKEYFEFPFEVAHKIGKLEPSEMRLGVSVKH